MPKFSDGTTQLKSVTEAGNMVSTMARVFDHPRPETCVFFADGGSEVVRIYDSVEEAEKGHAHFVEVYS